MSADRRITAIWLGLLPAAACGQKEEPGSTLGSSGTSVPGGSTDAGLTNSGPEVTGDSPEGSNGSNGSTSSISSTGSPPPTSGVTSTVGASTSGIDGTDASATDATSTNAGNTESSSGGSSGGNLPMECGVPLLDFKCFDAGDQEMLVTIDSAASVPPMATQDIPIDVSPCVDETWQVAGLVVDVGLQDTCLWSMELSIVCPSGEALALTTADMCGPCSPVSSYHAVFRQSAEVNCFECDFMNSLCIQAPVGGDYCAFLQSCTFEAGKPWALRVKTGATSVNIPTIGLHLAFEIIP